VLGKKTLQRPVAAADAETDLQRQLAVYRVLHDRYVSNAALQWQVAVYIIAAQAALLAGVVAAQSLPIRLSLGIADAIVGILGIFVCRRIELTAWIDREHLDQLEEIIAPDGPEFRLHHGDTFVQRLDRRGLSFSDRNLLRRLDLRIARFMRPGIGLAVLMTVLCGASLLVAAVGP
jgi:hypothetical protein